MMMMIVVTMKVVLIPILSMSNRSMKMIMCPVMVPAPRTMIDNTIGLYSMPMPMMVD